MVPCNLYFGLKSNSKNIEVCLDRAYFIPQTSRYPCDVAEMAVGNGYQSQGFALDRIAQFLHRL